MDDPPMAFFGATKSHKSRQETVGPVVRMPLIDNRVPRVSVAPWIANATVATAPMGCAVMCPATAAAWHARSR